MQISFLVTICTVALQPIQGHFFNKKIPDQKSITVTTEIAVPTCTNTVTNNKVHTVVETETVSVTYSKIVTPTITETSTSSYIIYQTDTITLCETATSTDHIQPTINLYELKSGEDVAPIPQHSVLDKRVVLDVFVRNKTWSDPLGNLHSSGSNSNWSSSHICGLISSFAIAMLM